MRQLYLASSGVLSRKDNTLMFETKRGKHFFPIFNIDCVHVYGEVTMNKRLCALLNKHRVPIMFYSHYGRYLGAYIPAHGHDGTTLLNQLTTYQSASARLHIARAIVDSAAYNMRSNLMYYNKHRRNKMLMISATAIENLKSQIDRITDVPRLLSIEGRIRENYYQAFDVVIKHPELRFVQRSYRPPKNEVNALISFLNTLLYNTISAIVYESRLNITIGFLHTTNRRSESLNLDIAETFKPLIVDRLVFKLINLKILRPEHFAKNHYLNKEGVKITLAAFDEHIKKTFSANNTRRSYITLIRKDVFALKNHINEGRELNFFRKKDS